MIRGILTNSTLTMILVVGACNSADLESLCIGIGACDSPQPPAVEVILLCDYSHGASCLRGTLDTAVVEIYDQLKDRPGSLLEIWTLGQSVGLSRSVAQVSITLPQRSGRPAVDAHHKVQLEEALKVIHQATQPYFGSPQPSRSPLIETLAKISLGKPNRQNAWDLIIISDGLEYSDLLDGECLPPADTLQFNSSIEKSGILTPDSFQNARVTFGWMTLGEIDGSRCPVEIQSFRRVRQLWSSLLTWAGAKSVRFEAGPPNPDALDVDQEAAKKGVR